MIKLNINRKVLKTILIPALFSLVLIFTLTFCMLIEPKRNFKREKRNYTSQTYNELVNKSFKKFNDVIIFL